MLRRALLSALLLACASVHAEDEPHGSRGVGASRKLQSWKPATRADRKSKIGLCGGAPRPWDPWGGYNAFKGRHLLSSLQEELAANSSSTRRLLATPTVRSDLVEKVTPLRAAYCKGKHMWSGHPLKHMSAAQLALARCLKAENAGCPADVAQLAYEAAQSLPSMKLLLAGPPCFSVYGARGQCASTAGNPETEPRGRYLNGIRPRTDWKWKQWDSCALVGRSPVIKIEENGPYIDKHEAVWRFNLAATQGFSNYVGKRTHLRLVNNGDSSRAMNGLAGKSEHSIFTVGNEEWTFWQYNSIPNIPRIHYKLKARTRLLSPFFIRWQMNAYFAVKHDLETLGLGPFHCPTSVSSGMHAVYMALAMCKRVSLFGYSYYDEMMTTRAGHNNGPQAFFSGHSWALDLAMVRLLHIAGHAQVCTGDDPSLDLMTLRNRQGHDY